MPGRGIGNNKIDEIQFVLYHIIIPCQKNKAFINVMQIPHFRYPEYGSPKAGDRFNPGTFSMNYFRCILSVFGLG